MAHKRSVMNASLSSWERLRELIVDENGEALTRYIDTLSPSETALSVSRLTEDERLRLFGLLSPEDAAELIEEIPEAQAADIVEVMPSEQVAAIMEEMPSDHIVDVLGEVDETTTRAILAKMNREEAREARLLLQ
jgi:magnesium transporter